MYSLKRITVVSLLAVVMLQMNTGAFAALPPTVDSNLAGVRATQGALDAEIANRIAGDQVLQNNIDTISLTPGPQGPAGTNTPDRTAELCALYHQLYHTSLIGALTIPAYCDVHYHIGDTGPAGGLVFYVTDDGLHGLEAAPVDQSSAIWGCVDIDITGAAGTAIGTGAQNTAAIVAGCPEAGTAAKVADAYALNGFTDWFLPSLDEMRPMLAYEIFVLGGFAADAYWTSTLIPHDPRASHRAAWIGDFQEGTPDGGIRVAPSRVRAVRAF